MALLLYGKLADRWLASGRDDGMLLSNPYALLALRCWLGTELAKHAGARIGQFARASLDTHERAHPGWYDRLLGERSTCDRCGETYRLENLSICTKCLGTYCPFCSRDGLPSGSLASAPVHSCGGDLVG
jgi:hypothetical protein